MAVAVVERHTFLELEDICAEAPLRRRSNSDGLLQGLGADWKVDRDVDADAATTLSQTSWESSSESAGTLWSDDLSERENELPVLEATWIPAPAQAPAPRWEKRQPVNPWGAENVLACSSRTGDFRTTLVLKSLPDGCSQHALREMLDEQGWRKCYDFLYAPTNFRKASLFGYCFVNFLEHTAAQAAMDMLRELRWERFGGARIEVYWSEPHQGLEVHLERYRNSPVMHRSVPPMYKPLLLRNGKVVAFPKPTQHILPPKDWSRRLGGQC